MAGDKDADRAGFEVVTLQAEPEDAPLPHTLPRTATQPYDLVRDQERTRGRIASGLVGLLAVMVLFSFLTVWFSTVEPSDLKELLSALLSPIAVLAGSATGFYFGGKGNAHP
jgi:hypothetical protein